MIAQGILGRSLRSLRIAPRSRPRGGERRPSAGGRGAGRTRARRGAVTRRRLTAGLGVVLVILVLAGGWMWLRDSSLVSVDHVTISGLSGAEAPQIHAALTHAARGMTTLDIRTNRLRAAVSSYPVVKGLSVSSSFPHGLHITVHEQLPVAAVVIGARQLPVAGDGTVLHDGEASGPLPLLSLKAAPGGSTITDPTARLELAVLAAAPPTMVSRISGVSVDYWHGVVITVRQGPAIYFGAGGRLTAKWQAALAVLAAPATAGASYIDVSDPQRASAGPANPASAGASTSGGGSSVTPSTGATGTSGAGATGAVAGTAGSTTTGGGG